uniref:Ssu-2 homolog n=1 Tax=Amphiprion percula TaxID=161767 RepID=A0A3P8UA52_AMPPE
KDQTITENVRSSRVPTVSEDVARDALIKFVESKWRYSSKPARNLTFKELKAITVYRYRLETYTETRTSTWQFEPYNGQLVDGPQYGVSPPPWDVQVMFPQRYADQVEKVRVPHSSFVKLCHKCNGCGNTRCTSCFGRGQVRWRRSSAVLTCPSSSRCFSCHGRGFKTCSVCHGSQNLLHFILLTVYPIQGFPDQEICDVSSKMINDHLVRFTSTSRILQQVNMEDCSIIAREITKNVLLIGHVSQIHMFPCILNVGISTL